LRLGTAQQKRGIRGARDNGSRIRRRLAISYQIGNVVVVVDGALTPRRAAAYAEVFRRVE